MKKKQTAPARREQKNKDRKVVEQRTIRNERIYRGGCHCGRIRFEVKGVLERVSECNCSICSRKGYLHWIVPRSAFRLMTPSDNIAAYSFNTKVAKHLFCPNCGVASFYIPRSDPDGIDVNVRCLEHVNVGKLELEHFDGRDWEKAMAGRKPSFERDPIEK